MRKRQSIFNKTVIIAMTVMLVFGLFPVSGLPTVSAATMDTIYAAAYMEADLTADTTLPETVEIGGKSTAVEWDFSKKTFDVPYETVSVTGTAGGETVTADVFVIPPSSNPLEYFVDSGRGGDSQGNLPSSSPFYEAVKALTGDDLLNEAPDQKYIKGETEWGFDDSEQGVKSSKDGGHTDPATDPSIWVVGLRAKNDDIVYRLKPLQPGTYTLTSGFHDWYGNRSRVMQPVIEYQDTNGDTQIIKLNQFNTNSSKTNHNEFSIPNDIDTSVTMTLTYDYVSGEKPILSWFTIANGEISDMINDAQNAKQFSITLDGNDIKSDNTNGLTFKGFGVLSANSTSALLMDYKSEHPEKYAELLKILFGGEHPLMTHVKIEMGNDRNNSTGPDPATMRTADEEANVARHPGFQLAADAKKLNPDLKVSILRWSAPGWIKDNNDVYKWYKNTILAAYREYGYMVNYVNPGVNEHSADLNWTKEYADRVRKDKEGFDSPEVQALYNDIEVVISDEVGTGSFGDEMVSDATLREAVSVAGFHYNTNDDSKGNFTRLAEEFDIEIWNSEAQATFGNSSFRPNNNLKEPTVAGTGIGGKNSALEMGNTIIKGFVNSRRTHFIYQPAIGSFYEGGQYSFKELVSARDPWSGWIHYDAGLVILQHFSWFANVGWENESNSANIWRTVPEASKTGATGTNPVSGRNGTPSYMTLAAPDKKDFSTVFINDSEYERTYTLQTKNMGYTGTPSLEMWETRAADEGQAFNSNYLKYLGDVSADDDGIYTINVKPNSIVTVTTLDNDSKTEYNTSLPVEGERTVLDTDETGSVHNTEDNLLYADDFDYSDKTVPVIGEDGQIIDKESYIESRGGSKGVIPRYTSDRNGAFEAYLDETGNYVLRQQVDRDTMGLGGTWNGGDPVTAIGDYRWTNYKASIDVSFENNSTKNGENYAAIGARYQGGGSSHRMAGTPYWLKFWFDGGWELLVNNSVVARGNVVSGDGGVKIEGFDASHDAWHNIAIQVAGDKVTAYIDNVEITSFTDPSPKLSGRVDLASGYYHTRFDNLRVEKVDGYSSYYSEALDNLEMYDLSSKPSTKLIYGGSWNHQSGTNMYHYQRTLSTSQEAGATLEYTFEGTGLDILGPNNGSANLEVTVDGKIKEQSAKTMASSNLYQTYTLRGLELGEHTVQIKVLSGSLTVDSVAVISDESTALPVEYGLSGVIYQGSSKADLPSTIDGKNITWDEFDPNILKDAYTTVTLTGKDGSGRKMSAGFEIVPTGLRYYTDLGIDASPAFDNVLKSIPSLLNQVTQQVKQDENTWGYLQDGIQLKENVDPNDKYATGIWSEKDKNITLKFTLPAGNYQLNAGFYEWWINSRSMNQTITFNDGEDNEIKGEQIVASKGSSTSSSTNFTLANDTEVTYTVSKAANDDPILSWVAINEVTDKTALQALYDANKDKEQGNYTEQSWTNFVTELQEAGEVLEDNQATQSEVNGALNALETSIDGLVEGEQLAEPIDIGFQGVVLNGSSKFPATVQINGENVEVEWDEVDVSTISPFEIIDVSGVTKEAITDGKRQPFTAKLQVTPINLVYFIDSGTQDSPIFNAVKETVQDLINEKSDQVASGEDWGYVNDGLNIKSSTDPMDIYHTGIWASGGKNITYKLPLTAGTYTLSAGFFEWWNQNRSMNQTISFTEGGEEVSIEGELVVLDGGDNRRTSSSTAFTLSEDTTITYTLKKAGGSDPIISWLAVSKEEAEQQVDTSALEQVIETAKGIEEAGQGTYTEESWTGFVSALEAAKTVLANSEATQEEVDHAKDALQSAIDALEEIPVDTTALEQVIKAAQAIEEAGQGTYTEESWTGFVSALESAKTVLANSEATQEVVDHAKDALQTAIDALEEIPVDTAALEQVIKAAQAIEEAGQGTYTEESWTGFVSALEVAKTVLANSEATQEEVDHAKDALQSAIDALEEIPVDTTALEQAIEAAESIEEAGQGNYTEESWTVFVTALESAKTVLANSEATQEVVDQAKDALQTAINALVKDSQDGQDGQVGQNGQDDKDDQGNSNKDNVLPTTATSTFNILLIGSLLLVAGIIIFSIRKRKKA